MATSSTNFLASSANSSNCGVIVWEWFEDNGSWQPYESDVVAFIEDNYVKGASAVNLGKINPNLSLYNVIFSSTSYQIRLDTGKRRHVRRKMYQMTSPDLNKISWQWAGDYVGQWNSYSFEVASMIESVYAGQQTNFIDLSQTQFKIPYFIDLKNFQQVRIETGTARNIRREKLTVPFPISNGNIIQPSQTFQQSALIPTNITSLLGQSSQPSYQHLSQVTSALYSMSAHASQIASSSNPMSAHAAPSASSSNSMSALAAPSASSSNSMSAHAAPSASSSNSMSAHASQIASSSNSMSSHALQVSSSNSLSAHAAPSASSFNSMPAHASQVSSSHLMSGHASQVASSSNSSLGKRRRNSDDSDGGKVASGGKKAKNVAAPSSNHSYVQSYVNNLPSSSAVSNSMPQNSMPQNSMPQNTMPQIMPYPSHMMYGNQMTGLITSSPYLSSLGLSSPTFNMAAGPSQHQSTGPLTRQQLQQMIQTSSFGGSLNMPMTPVSSGFTFSNGITVPGLSNNTMMNNVKGHGSKISPVVSNITNVLTSPLVPGAFTPTLGPAPSLQPTTNSWTGSSSKPSSLPSKGHIVLPKLKKSKEKSKSELPNKFLKPVVNPADTEDCCICCEKLNTESGYGNSNHSDGEVVALSLCNHMFHRQCLMAMYNSGPKDGSIQCPNCKKIHGLKLGTCPGGEMEYWTMSESLPGHSDCGSICVRYNIRSGTQGPEHPSPGSRYSTYGFPRVGYLPDNLKGRKVLQLFIVAWKRRIMFTIGTSSTSGYQNTVTWNEIHHKTEFGSNNSGHGYPDPNYLDNVLLELAVQGVTEEDLNDP